MDAALESFKNKPILGFIHEVDGVPQFKAHEFHEDEDGNTVYEEIPIGIVPESCDAHYEHSDEYDKDFVVINGYIYEVYASKAAEILKREGECSVSIEIDILEMSYDAESKLLKITKFVFDGVTILGVDEDGNKIEPGMTGANIKLADFDKKNNSMFNNKELFNAIKELNENIKILNDKKEGGIGALNLFEQLLEKYGKTREDITFEFENLTDEELTAKFEEMFGSTENPEPKSDPEPESTKPNNEYSLTLPDGTVKTFSLTLDDIQFALCDLVNTTYSEDNDWYGVTVFADESYLVMSSWWTGNAYKQSYSREGDTFSLTGERIAVHSIWVTDEEEAKIKSTADDYEAAKTELAQYQKKEQDEKKKSLIEDEHYSAIKETEEFKAIVAEENKETFDKMSADELSAKLDKIVLDYAKSGKLSFAKKDTKNTFIRLPFSTGDNNKPGRYGDIFKK